MDLKKTKPSKNFEDRTYPDRVSELDWIHLLGAHHPLTGDPIPLLPTEREDLDRGVNLNDILFRRAMAFYGNRGTPNQSKYIHPSISGK